MAKMEGISQLKPQHKVLLKSVVVHPKLDQHRSKMVWDGKLRSNVEFKPHAQRDRLKNHAFVGCLIVKEHKYVKDLTNIIE